ncbi:MAG: hypothetical protein LBI15_00860, partial [Dysgonamonadaceae bacterium]|nr:hypothetical protein [Dysgonamonadaceae bacterium]
MKYLLSAILLSLTAISVFSQPVARFEQNGVKVEVLEFKELDEQLHVVWSVQTDSRGINRHQGLNITLGVETANSLLLLPSFTVMGNNKRSVLARHFHNNASRLSNGTEAQPAFDIDWLSDNLSTHRISIPYELWFDDAQLSVRQEVAGFRGETVYSHFLLGTRIELSPREPYSVQTQVALTTPEREVKILDRSGQAFLDFASGSSVIQPNFRRNPEELRKIEEAVRAVTTNPDATLQGIF